MISSFNPRYMSQTSLHRKVDYYFLLAKDGFCAGNERIALKSAEKLTELSEIDYKSASFKMAFNRTIREKGDAAFFSQGFARFVVNHLPVQNSAENHFFLREDGVDFQVFVDKIIAAKGVLNRNSPEEQPGNYLGAVFEALMKKGHHKPALEVIDFMIKNHELYEDNFDVTAHLFKPLISSTDIDIVREWVSSNEDNLLRLGYAYNGMDEYAPSASNSLTINEIVKFNEFNSLPVTLMLLKNSSAPLSANDDIDCLTKISDIAGQLEGHINLMAYSTFYRNLSVDVFKPYAHHFIHTRDNYLPFKKDPEHYGETDILEKVVFFKLPGSLDGLKSVLESTPKEKDDRAHLLITTLQDMASHRVMLEELAQQIPDKYINSHKSLLRLKLENDFGM